MNSDKPNICVLNNCHGLIFFFHVDMLLNTLVSDFYNFPLAGPCTVDPKSHPMVNTWSDIVKIIANDMIDVWLWFKMIGPPTVKWHDLTLRNVITFVIFGLVPSFRTIDSMNEILIYLRLSLCQDIVLHHDGFTFLNQGIANFTVEPFVRMSSLFGKTWKKRDIFEKNVCILYTHTFPHGSIFFTSTPNKI